MTIDICVYHIINHKLNVKLVVYIQLTFCTTISKRIQRLNQGAC